MPKNWISYLCGTEKTRRKFYRRIWWLEKNLPQDGEIFLGLYTENLFPVFQTRYFRIEDRKKKREYKIFLSKKGKQLQPDIVTELPEVKFSSSDLLNMVFSI